MSDYNIVIGPTEFFICRHPHHPHDGSCEPSEFVHGKHRHDWSPWFTTCPDGETLLRQRRCTCGVRETSTPEDERWLLP